MEATSFLPRLLLIVVVIIVIVIAWIVIVKLPECCDPCADCPDGFPPGKGSEIIVTPPGAAGTHAQWSADGAELTSGSAGDSGFLRDDAFGEVHTFTVQGTSGSPVAINKLVLKLTGSSESVVVERTATNHLAWTVDGTPLQACETKSSDPAIPDCVGIGLPIEFERDIDTFEAVTVSGATITSLAISQIAITAQK